MPEPQPLPTDAPTFPYPVTFRRLHRHTPSIPQPLPESTDDLASHTLPASTHKPTKPRKMLRGGGSTCPNPSPVPPPPGNVSPVAQAHPQPLPRTHPRPLQETPEHTQTHQAQGNVTGRGVNVPEPQPLPTDAPRPPPALQPHSFPYMLQ